MPPGPAVVQLGGDPANCELGNLTCVPRGVLSILNCHGGTKSGRQVKPSRVSLMPPVSFCGRARWPWSGSTPPNGGIRPCSG